MTTLVRSLVKVPIGRRAFDFARPHLVGPAGGPDATERARTRTHAVAVARGSATNILAEVHVEGPSIYSITAEFMAWAGRQLADGNALTPGVVGPIE